MADSNITKKALASAMKNLMENIPFSKINVADICEACDMNRKSFYYHFKDKYDLVNWIYYTEFIETLYRHTYTNGWELLYDICSYFHENRSFYTNALKVSGQNSFHDYFYEVLEPVVSHYLDEVIPKDENSAFFITFFTDAFTGSIERWLLGNPSMTPDVFVSLLKSTITGVARKIVSELDS